MPGKESPPRREGQPAGDSGEVSAVPPAGSDYRPYERQKMLRGWRLRDTFTGLEAWGETEGAALANLVSKLYAEREAQEILLGRSDKASDPRATVDDLMTAAWLACVTAYMALLRLPLAARATPERQGDLARARDAIALLTQQDPELVQATHEMAVSAGADWP